jgi:hypothetical protein
MSVVINGFTSKQGLEKVPKHPVYLRAQVLSSLVKHVNGLFLHYFCQMQGGGGECESTGTGPGAEQRGRTDGGTRGAATGTIVQSCTV